jgi:hypothetical protein
MSSSVDTASAHPTRARSNRRQVLMALVIFVCGILIGIGLTSRYLWSHYAERPPVIPGMSSRLANHMIEELELNETQADQVREIMVRWEAGAREVHREVHGRFEQLFTELRSEISEVLTEEQMITWDDRTRKMKERWSKRGRRSFPGDRHRLDGKPRGNHPPPESNG